MITVDFANSLSSTGKTWTFTDSTDYSAVVLSDITLKIWTPGQDPSVDTEQINYTVDINNPNDPVTFNPTDFGLANDNTLLVDGIYTIDLIITSNDQDSPQTQRGYFLNVHNIKVCINNKTSAAYDKTCDCRDEDFAYINKMQTIKEGMCFNFQRQNFTEVNSQLATLQNMCDDDAPCNC